MTKTLREFDINYGPASDGTDFIKSFCVLGHPAVAEFVLDWSQKNPIGSTLVKKLGWGLELTFLANESNPRVLLALDKTKLKNFVALFSATITFHFIDYGVMVTGPTNDTTEAVRGGEASVNIVIPLNSAESIKLYHWSQTEDDGLEHVALGAIDLGEEGFNFISASELKKLTEPDADDAGAISIEDYASLTAEEG